MPGDGHGQLAKLSDDLQQAVASGDQLTLEAFQSLMEQK
eukprot:symbB.v1.2.010820.t1/scaffold711.1/size292957/1